MNIYLNDRLITLSESQPEQIIDTGRVIAFSSPKNLKKSFEEFEQSPGIKHISVYSENDFQELKKAFISLFTVIDAAGGLIFNEKGEKLFIFRYGKWDLPKGKMHKNEKPEEAALREVKEETGLQHVAIVRELPATFHIYNLKSKRILKHTYWFAMSAGSGEPLIPQTEEDISIVKWIDRAGIVEVLSNTYASLGELIRS